MIILLTRLILRQGDVTQLFNTACGVGVTEVLAILLFFCLTGMVLQGVARELLVRQKVAPYEWDSYSTQGEQDYLILSQLFIFNNIFSAELMLTLRIALFMARNVRRGARGASELVSKQQENSIKQQGSRSIVEDQLDDEIEPLSYDRQVQQSLKNKIAQELKYSYEGQDPNPHKLVHRPSKGAAWGLGGQLMLASKKVELQGLKPEENQIVQFLQLHQVKNIYIHDFFAQNPDRPDTNRKRYAILGSCFSAKHGWKVAIELKNAFNLNSAKTKLRRKQVYDPIYAIMHGGKDEQWNLVSYKDYEISLMTEQQREAMDLQWKWNNPPKEETVDKHLEMKSRKGWKRQFEDM